MYFFDLDGTVLDSNGVWGAIDRQFLGRFGVEQVPADYTDYVTHHSFPEAAAYTRSRYAHSLTEEEIMETWRAMAAEAYGGQLPLKPGVRDFLDRAGAAGIRCAMVTSCLPELCASALEGHGLTEYFEAVFTTRELELEKRERALYLEVARRCGVRPEDCTLFEDSPVNCLAAHEAGWRVFGMYDPLFADRREEFEPACGKEGYPFSFLSPLP